MEWQPLAWLSVDSLSLLLAALCVYLCCCCCCCCHHHGLDSLVFSYKLRTSNSPGTASTRRGWSIWLHGLWILFSSFSKWSLLDYLVLCTSQVILAIPLHYTHWLVFSSDPTYYRYWGTDLKWLPKLVLFLSVQSLLGLNRTIEGLFPMESQHAICVPKNLKQVAMTRLSWDDPPWHLGSLNVEKDSEEPECYRVKRCHQHCWLWIGRDTRSQDRRREQSLKTRGDQKTDSPSNFQKECSLADTCPPLDSWNLNL